MKWEFDEEEINIPEEFEGHDRFYNFLVYNGILELYLYNFRNFSYQNRNDLKRFLDNTTPRFFFNSFNWILSKGDVSIWIKNDSRWRFSLLKNRERDENILKES